VGRFFSMATASDSSAWKWPLRACQRCHAPYVPLASAGSAYLCVPILMVDMLIFFAGCSADMER
jgi:hypothetical protein